MSPAFTVGTGTGAPLPTAVVRGDLAIDEVLHEELLSEAPVDVQVLGQEHGGNHPEAIMHETGG